MCLFLLPEKFQEQFSFRYQFYSLCHYLNTYEITVNPIRIVSKEKHRLEHDESKTKTRLQNQHKHKIHYLRTYKERHYYL